ncbi:thermonuclease family protein [Endomicrobium proavitum]|uniref:Putative nuclease n=1 Tax=Endomicrobium proavitum TaxID=1408281 RepID=A0A0G3WJN3_9BACT|nr:thermonuclease family protein [Endomicrobium proavitum]AKL98090.1 putative nuclease [Endomicrobium proavitum]
MAKKKASVKKTTKLLAFLFAIIVSGFFAKETVVKDYAEPVKGVIAGKVTKIADGDTLTIINSDNKLVKIRLYGIDAPETKQEFGSNSKQFLSSQINGKYITVDVIDIDKYKRSVGRVFIDDLDINREMVKNGYAWVYSQYMKLPEKSEWENLQTIAKADKKGLWQEDNPTAPWKWRKDPAYK